MLFRSLGETTYRLPDPFLVLATQNPIDQEGTYQLPEAQLDRFLFKVLVTYPCLLYTSSRHNGVGPPGGDHLLSQERDRHAEEERKNGEQFFHHVAGYV